MECVKAAFERGPFRALNDLPQGFTFDQLKASCQARFQVDLDGRSFELFLRDASKSETVVENDVDLQREIKAFKEEVLTLCFHVFPAGSGPPPPPRNWSQTLASLEEKIADLNRRLEAEKFESMLARWNTQVSRSTSNSYSSVYKSTLEGPDARTNCEWLEVCQEFGVSCISAGSAGSAWRACRDAVSADFQRRTASWPARSDDEKLYQPILECVLKCLLALRTDDSGLRVLSKPHFGEAIPDAALHLQPSFVQWSSVCLPFELENGEESKKRHGMGQAVSYLQSVLSPRRSSQRDRLEGFSVFTNLYEIVVIAHRSAMAEDGSLTFQHWATKELPLFSPSFCDGNASVSEGFVALLSLLQAPAHRLASPLATLPGDLAPFRAEFPTLISWKGGTQVWCAKDKTSVLKIALMPERREQLAQELRVITKLAENPAAPCSWRAEWQHPRGNAPSLRLQPVGTRSLVGHDGCTPQEAMSLVKQLVLQLRYCHTVAHIFHCDIRPSNIVLLADGSPCLIDWGLAQPFAPHENFAHLSSVPGVFAWMSDGAAQYRHKQLHRQSSYTYRASDDLESLAYVYFALLNQSTSAPVWKYLGTDPKKFHDFLDNRRKRLSDPLYPSTKFLSVLREFQVSCPLPTLYDKLLAQL